MVAMLTWHRDIEKTTNTLQVVRLAREYLAALSPSDFARIPHNCLPGHVIDESDISRYSARLPQACRPGRLRDEQDVELLHTSLVEAYRETREAGENLTALQEMTGMVVRASIRIVEIGDASKPSGENPGDSIQAQAPRSQ